MSRQTGEGNSATASVGQKCAPVAHSKTGNWALAAKLLMEDVHQSVWKEESGIGPGPFHKTSERLKLPWPCAEKQCRILCMSHSFVMHSFFQVVNGAAVLI